MGRRAALDALPTFREDFIPNAPPFKIEVGTFVYENVAGMRAAIEYLADLGAICDGSQAQAAQRKHLATAMQAIHEYETTLTMALLQGLRSIKGATVYGLRDPQTSHLRVPTVCFNLRNVSPDQVTTRLADKGIAVRDGNMYAPRLMKRLGLSPDSGAVRASLVHYNTLDEIRLFLGELQEIAGQ